LPGLGVSVVAAAAELRRSAAIPVGRVEVPGIDSFQALDSDVMER
jgi:hypothetical protein